ncbi:hypothetical protein Adeg_0428 [Ammonifex degensii KC4]|uniref:Uncharacterized protein n=1 Tax=Ammonifex degensii (strain DSM 10501 / KC4) TaxID=429009 RepID=C9RBF4_AMMDK|nr:hypothetical protein Adeg_0428 [Ammonifex degensii KC4]
MTLYQQLKRSGNPHAIAQTVASLLTTCSPKEVARIMGCSVLSRGITHPKMKALL